MVMKQARPPTALEIGSAQKTPATPMPSLGSRTVRGATMTALRSREKKDRPLGAAQRGEAGLPHELERHEEKAEEILLQGHLPGRQRPRGRW